MNPERVPEALALIDRYMKAALQKSADLGNKVTCSAGCFYCCKEPVYAERAEVAFVVASLSAEQRERATASARLWWYAFFSSGLDRCQEPKKGAGFDHLLRYRAEKLWCTLLHDGLCAGYAAHPIACRIHSA